MNEKIDIVCLGEALIDFFAVQKGTYLPEVESFKKAPGGAPANVAVGCAKLGLKTSFLGRVGDDEFGRFLAGILEDNSVDISQLQYDKNIRTGLAFISLPTPNTREFLFYRNPSADMYNIIKKGLKDLLKNERILIEALEFSSAAAALTSTRKGVVNSLPSKKEIEKFLLKYK